MTNETPYMNVDSVSIQISADGQRVWVCVDGGCILRVRGIEALEIIDNRVRCDKHSDLRD